MCSKLRRARKELYAASGCDLVDGLPPSPSRHEVGCAKCFDCKNALTELISRRRGPHSLSQVRKIRLLNELSNISQNWEPAVNRQPWFLSLSQGADSCVS
eukprot:3319722-Pyramimonas_sp.AAC.1